MVAAMKAREGYVDFRGYRTWYRFVGDLNSGALRRCSRCTAGRGRRTTTSRRSRGSPTSGLSSSTTRSAAASRIGPTTSTGASSVFREEVAAVRDQLGLERIHLLGTSWGGMLAQEHVLSGARGSSA